jgi:Peptidase family M28
MEAARIFSEWPVDHQATLVFALLSGEEQGLMGGRLLAETAKERGWNVSAMLNNDIVGGVKGTDGRVVDNVVRVFSEGIRASEDLPAQMARRNSGGEDDGPSRALMRFAKGVDVSAGLEVFGVERPDRFSRGGDHLPALELGFPAIRFTVGVEDYDHQHQDLRTENGRKYGDTVDEMDFAYLSKVTRLNVLTAAHLALGPPAPESATLAGAVSSDTKISWKPVKGATVLGYQIFFRRAEEGAPWKPGPYVEGPDAQETVMKGVIVDDHFFAVAAVGPDGGQSISTFAGLPPRN